MIPVGYMYKKIVIKPDWLKAANIVDVYSLSNCISHGFADYINYWQHNGYWLFDSPATRPCFITKPMNTNTSKKPTHGQRSHPNHHA